MNSSLYQSRSSAVDTVTHIPERSGQVSFPWVYFILAWAILFPYQNPLNPNEYDTPDFSEIVRTARSGNLTHEILAFLLGVLGIVSFVKYGKGLHFRGLVGSILLGYLSWSALSITWSDDAGVTLRRQIAFAVMLAFGAGCAARMTKENLSLFAAGLAILNLFAAIVQEVVRGTAHTFSAGGNRFGGAVSPNLQGATLSLAAIVMLWCAWRSRGISRLKWLCIASLLFVFVIATGSRTSLLGLLGALLGSFTLIGIRRFRADIRLIGAVVALIFAFGGMIALTSSSSISSSEKAGITKILLTDRDVGELSDLTGRNRIWEVCSRYAIERPIFGYGYGGFWTGTRLEAIADELKWPAAHAHSAYLDVLLETGIPGAALYILLLIGSIATCVSRFLKHNDAYGALAAMLVFFAINGLTESLVVLPTLPALVLTMIWMAVSLDAPLRQPRSAGADKTLACRYNGLATAPTPPYEI